MKFHFCLKQNITSAYNVSCFVIKGIVSVHESKIYISVSDDNTSLLQKMN